MDLQPYSETYFMRQALEEARLAFEEGEIPIGAVVVCRGQIIARAHNEVERLKDPTAHAELLAITAATEYMGGKFLSDCQLYVTVEPCVMCAGALFWARLGEIIYGAGEEKFGYRHYAPDIFPRRAKVRGGVLSEEAAELMRSFFATRR
ncbi:cytidine and deoxycytidylate deaminase zinc-binding region [Porphyromonas sp. oral taxon 278 str. W7784]|jgi:tRNA-specific adenosine deaminase|nr:nucleoside deaminase [Porphyromonas sp. oral taxon 278]ERJ73213.1 cytidine and deoxycytidylate deaminase zinc-binding region [Porphyromonas sp. oral taxon 278 str. W7784]